MRFRQVAGIAKHRLLNKVFPGRMYKQPIRMYRELSVIGNNSPNPWIRKSAEIGGWLFPDEHEFLWSLASEAKQGHILEIGSWMGKSTCILAGACIESAPETRVICVDPFDMGGTDWQVSYHKKLVKNAASTLDIFRANARRLGFIDYVIPVAAPSEKVLPTLSFRLRMAFLDGVHDHSHVTFETKEAERMLLPGGILALHDTGEAWPEVKKFAEEELPKNKRFEFIGKKGTISAFRFRT